MPMKLSKTKCWQTCYMKLQVLKSLSVSLLHGKGSLESQVRKIDINEDKRVRLDTPGVKEGFAVDAWLANNDVVGQNFDNMMVDSDGNAIRIDNGGALLYRAQGSRKGFGIDVTEINDYRDKSKLTRTTCQLFKDIANADVIASIDRVLAITDDRITELCTKFGPGSLRRRQVLADKLIGRKTYLAQKRLDLLKLGGKTRRRAVPPM